MIQDTDTVHVRYMVDDVGAAVNFYTTHLVFTLLTNYGPAFADVKRGNLRLLLSGPASQPVAVVAEPGAGTSSMPRWRSPRSRRRSRVQNAK